MDENDYDKKHIAYLHPPRATKKVEAPRQQKGDAAKPPKPEPGPKVGEVSGKLLCTEVITKRGGLLYDIVKRAESKPKLLPPKLQESGKGAPLAPPIPLKTINDKSIPLLDPKH